jgi:folate-dependent phosphoribosylglycinamide formyltransferase PurN
MKLFVGNRVSFIKPYYENFSDDDLVVTNKNSKLDVFASERSLKIKYYKDRNTLLEILENANFEILFSAGCPYILPVKSKMFENKTLINTHPSLLPKFPGVHCITEAMYKGGPFGTTIHTMGETADSGRLIAQREITVPSELIASEIYELIFKEEEKLILDSIVSERFDYKNIDFKSLNYITPEATNFRRNLFFREIKPTMSIREIEKRVKILNVKNHYAFIDKNNSKSFITSISFHDIKKSRNSNNDFIEYQAKDGIIYLQTINMNSEN